MQMQHTGRFNQIVKKYQILPRFFIQRNADLVSHPGRDIFLQRASY